MNNRVHLDQLTVFVISSGEETESDCLNALELQDCTFIIKHIRGVSPMSSAFQTMADQCQTRYFLQVDADMILNKDAVLKLYTVIVESPFWVYRVSGALYEEGFGVGGAVKCWKHSVFRFIHFHDCRTVDRNFHNRLRWFGFRIKAIHQIVGVHRPRHSDFSLYLKTKSDIEKWRFLERPSARYAAPLFEEILDERVISPYRLLGLLLGALTGYDRLIRSKDTSLEKVRFKEILKLIHQKEEALVCNVDLINRKKLGFVFEAGYDDFRGQDLSKRIH